MIIVCISDTHEQHGRMAPLPKGDVLIHAGDLTGVGKLHALVHAADWLRKQPHKYKVVVAGNHDHLLQTDPEVSRELFRDLIYLNRTAHMIEGKKFYGTPWSPAFNDWAFNATPEQQAEHAAAIPQCDVLVSHGPPRGYGDRCDDGRRVGCVHLMERIEQIRPKLVVSGHIHEDRGIWILPKLGTTIVNASVLNAKYRLANKPVVIEI